MFLATGALLQRKISPSNPTKLEEGFKRFEIAANNLKKYSELSAKNIIERVSADGTFASYLPDKTRRTYRVNEAFLLAIVNKLYAADMAAVERAPRTSGLSPSTQRKV